MALSGVAVSASAAPLAKFDVGGNNSNGDGAGQLVPDATWAPVGPGIMSNTQNGITLTINDASPETRDRTSAVIASEPLEAVFRDFLFTRAADGAVSIVFSGLTAGAEYSITSYAFDSSGGNNETGFWYLGSVAPENLQHSWLSSTQTVDDGEDIFELTGTADGAGTLTYLVTTNNTSRINGFEVNLVPEPGSLALLGLGTLLVARRRRG